MTVVSLLLVVFKIVEAVMNRLDEANRRKVILAAAKSLRIEVEDEVVSRAVAAFSAAMSESDDVQHPGRHYRD